MSERVTTYCDQCGAAKGEGNHWHKAVVFSPAIQVDLNGPKLDVAIAIGDCTSAKVDGPEVRELDFCGVECVLKYASKILKGE